MKGVLAFLLLLSFVVNVYSQCQPNEVLDEQTQKCEKFCEIGEVFNQDTTSCEPNPNATNTTCPEGQIFNNATSTCENINKKQDQSQTIQTHQNQTIQTHHNQTIQTHQNQTTLIKKILHAKEAN